MQHKSYLARNQERKYCSLCGKSYGRASTCRRHIKEKHLGIGYPVREPIYLLDQLAQLSGKPSILTSSLSTTQPNPYSIMSQKAPTFVSARKQVARLKEQEEEQPQQVAARKESEIQHSKTPLDAFNLCADEFLKEYGKILARSQHAPLKNLPAGTTFHIHNTYHNYNYNYSTLPSSSSSASTSSFFSLASSPLTTVATTTSSSESFSSPSSPTSSSQSSHSSSSVTPPADVVDISAPLSSKQEQEQEQEQQQKPQRPLIESQALEQQQRRQVEQEFSRLYVAARGKFSSNPPHPHSPRQPSRPSPLLTSPSCPSSSSSQSPAAIVPPPATSNAISTTTTPTESADYGDDDDENNNIRSNAEREKDNDEEAARLIGIQASVCRKCHAVKPRVFRSLPRRGEIIVEDVHFNCKRSKAAALHVNDGKEKGAASDSPTRIDNKISRDKVVCEFLKDRVIQCMRKGGQTDTMMIATEVAITPYPTKNVVRKKNRRVAGKSNHKGTSGKTTTTAIGMDTTLKFTVSYNDESKLRSKYWALKYSDAQCILLNPKNTGDWALRVIRDGSTRINEAELDEFLQKTKTKTFAFFKKIDKDKTRTYLIAVSETDYCEDGSNRNSGNCCKHEISGGIRISQLMDMGNVGHSNNIHRNYNFADKKASIGKHVSL